MLSMLSIQINIYKIEFKIIKYITPINISIIQSKYFYNDNIKNIYIYFKYLLLFVFVLRKKKN